MATILVVDDRPTNRQFLITLLGYVGHRVVEASDGVEALEVARAEQPDLMIVDIVMPRMDGVEFVRQLRKESRFDSAVIMFYTATYRLTEAAQLARKVGVSRLLQKPAQPEAILDAVNSALHESRQFAGANDGLNQKEAVASLIPKSVLDVERVNIRLTAIIELALDLTIESDPKRMLDIACRAARSICEASYGAIGILHSDGQSLCQFNWDASDADSAHSPSPPSLQSNVLAEVIKTSRPIRMGADDADLTEFAPPGYLAVDSLIAIPLATPHRTLGWLYLIDKYGHLPFSEEDERILVTLGSFIAMVYENMFVSELEQITSELRQSQTQLQSANATLESRVAQRTAELNDSVNELEKKNIELDQFTYVASHDLQEPVRKLISFSELLAKDIDGELNEQASRDLHYITDAAHRMQTLVQDLLALSRAGRSAIQQEVVDLNVCADLALDSLSMRIEETGAEITRDSLPQTVGDRTTLTQLFQNLIGNALKFVGDRRPVIHITVEVSDDELTIGVRDNGIGIDLEYAEHVFEPFKRLHGRDRYQGSGIGLSICRKTVERHGGRIWIESEPGLGSNFKFTLPQIINPQQQDALDDAVMTVVECEA